MVRDEGRRCAAVVGRVDNRTGERYIILKLLMVDGSAPQGGLRRNVARQSDRFHASSATRQVLWCSTYQCRADAAGAGISDGDGRRRRCSSGSSQGRAQSANRNSGGARRDAQHRQRIDADRPGTAGSSGVASAACKVVIQTYLPPTYPQLDQLTMPKNISCHFVEHGLQNVKGWPI